MQSIRTKLEPCEKKSCTTPCEIANKQCWQTLAALTMDIMPMKSITVAWNCTEEEEDRAMSRDYPMNGEEHYRVYFQHDAIDWESLEVTHYQLLDGHRAMTDSQLGARIRRVKEENAIEEGAEKCFYMSDYTAQELGAEWRQNYQDSYYSQ